MISNQILLKPSSVVRILGAVAFLLVLASTVGQLTIYMAGGRDSGLVQLFFLDAEQNMPTFFSSLILLFASLLLAVITILEKNRKTFNVSYWALLSFGFLFMAIDEFVCLHEKLELPMRKLLGGSNFGFFHFAWVIPGIALVFVLALFLFRFWWRLPAKTRLTFFIAASIYLAGCLGFEMIGGYCDELYGQQNLTYVMLTTIEESLEMTGVIVFIWGLLKYIADNYKEVRLRLDGVSEEE